MKTRQGLVSNSSTTSFCIVGIADNPTIEKVIKADPGIIDWSEECSQGYAESQILEYFGTYEERLPDYAGIPAEALLQTMNIPEACQHLKAVLETKGIKIPLTLFGFFYGEAGH